jgi:S-formylglutathione hydrolase
MFWLSGLTCTWENFSTKSGAFAHAAKHGIAIIAPDTSPRGAGVDGETASWDFGAGAGFYVDATTPGWKENYRMYTYVTIELPAVLRSNLPALDLSRQSIAGHSMGGLGALMVALKNPGMFRAVSAFSPIAHPSKAPWGIKAFSGYLGAESEADWAAYDPTDLVAAYKGPRLPIHIDQGTGDEWLHKGQLLPDDFLAAAAGVADVPVKYSSRDGYDHSYWYISTFIGEHIAEHAAALKAST